MGQFPHRQRQRRLLSEQRLRAANATRFLKSIHTPTEEYKLDLLYLRGLVPNWFNLLASATADIAPRWVSISRPVAS